MEPTVTVRWAWWPFKTTQFILNQTPQDGFCEYVADDLREAGFRCELVKTRKGKTGLKVKLNSNGRKPSWQERQKIFNILERQAERSRQFWNDGPWQPIMRGI